jgi:PAS domain S-box-containing protein
MFIVWGAELRCFYNDACAPILGGRHPEALGRPLPEAWSGIWPMIHPLIDQALTGTASQSEDLPMAILKDGRKEMATFVLAFSPLEDTGGAVAGLFCTCTETTSKVAAEVALRKSEEAQKRLRASEQRFRQLAENTGDVISVSDLDRTLQYVSPMCHDLLGYDPEELIGRSLKNAHPDDRERVLADFEDLFSGRKKAVTSPVYRMQHKDGHWISVEARRRLLLDDQGRPQGIINVVRDMTDRQRLEEQLRQSQKMEAVGQLTGGIAHDFNNLLTVILGNAELLADDELDIDEMRRLSSVILETAERGAELIQHLLAFGRRQTLTPVRLRLGDVVYGMLPLLQRSIGEQIELKTDLSNASTMAMVDRTLLQSAILNLVVNARDAILTGGTITITTGQRAAMSGEGLLEAGQDVVFLTVADTGTGMPPEVVERAFEPFFTTKEVGKGSGLGLSMVYGFVSQSGGHVAIDSVPGTGTAVTIALRATVGSAVEASAPRHSAPLKPGTERLLVVEDEEAVLNFLAAQLTNLGYEVTSAVDAPEALAILDRDRNFDLLLTDVVLPKGISGIDLARAARAMKSDLKVLYTSGYSDEIFKQQSGELNNIRLLRKPYKRRELAAALRAELDVS